MNFDDSIDELLFKFVSKIGIKILSFLCLWHFFTYLSSNFACFIYYLLTHILSISFKVLLWLWTLSNVLQRLYLNPLWYLFWLERSNSYYTNYGGLLQR